MLDLNYLRSGSFIFTMTQSSCSVQRFRLSQSHSSSHHSTVNHHLIKLVFLVITVFAQCCHTTTEEPTYQDGGLATTLATDTFTIADCKLQVNVPDNVRENLIIEDRSVHFVYANLEFLNQDLDLKTGYLSNATRYITPLRWVVASGRRGNVFLGLPTIFEELSLWTLGIEVISEKVTVNADQCAGFINATDAVKQDLIAGFLYESINTTGLPDLKVCQEIAHLPSALLGDATWVALLYNIYFVVYNTRHECWYEKDAAVGQLSTQVISPPAWLLPPTITLGILGAIVFPLLVIRFIQRNNSPLVREVCKRDANGVRIGTGKVRRYYNRSTSIPVGLKYLLCYHSTSLVEVVRSIILSVLFYVLFCPEIFFPLDETFRLRFHAYRRKDYLITSFTGYYVVRTIMVFLPLLWFVPSLPMFFRNAYKWRRFKLADIPTGVRPYHAESALERSYFGLFPIPDIQSRIPPHPQAVAGLSCLYYYMVSRIQSALDVGFLFRCYTQSLRRVWDIILKMMWCNSPQSLWEIMASVSCVMTLAVTLPMLVPFYFFLLCFSTFIYLLPSAYVLLCVTNTHSFIIAFANWFYEAGFWRCYERDSKDNDEDDQVAMEMDTKTDSGIRVLQNDEETEKKQGEVVMAKDDSKDDTNEVSMATEAKDDTNAVATKVKDDITEIGTATEASDVVLDSGPRQTIVEFRRGSGASGSGHIEYVYPLHGIAARHYHKFWPLHHFYHNVYKSMIGEDECDGQGRSSQKLCLEILFVLFALLYTVFLLVAIALIVFLLQILIWSIVALLSSLFIIYFFRIVVFCTLVGTVMLLSFTGLVLNTLRVMPYCLLSLSLFGFVVSVVTQLYGAYVKMLRMVIERCLSLRKDLCFVLVEREIDDGDEMVAEEEEEEEEEDDAKKSSSSGKKKPLTVVVAVDKLPSDDSAASNDADVMIEERLFWYVADKCKPLRVQVMSGILQIIAVILAVVVGIVVLVDIGELQDFTHFGVSLVILVITLLITHTRSLIALTEEEEKDDFERAVKKAVIGFDAEKKV